MGFPRQEYWGGFPCLPPGDLPDPGIEPKSLTSPALAGRFFTTSTTWGFKILFIFGCAGSSLLRRLPSGCGVWASHVTSLVSEFRLWGVGASVVIALGLSSSSSRALEHRLNGCGARA